jgi:hypothetical protein
MFTLILSLSALAAEAAPITLTPAPAPTFLVGANPPVRVRGQTPVPSGAATSCVCDHERLGCAVQGGVMSAWWTVRKSGRPRTPQPTSLALPSFADPLRGTSQSASIHDHRRAAVAV